MKFALYYIMVNIISEGSGAVQINWYILIALVLYFAILVTIGLVTFKKDEDMEGYALGGRALGPWVTSMSAKPSDMSGWMLMGLPGYAYMAGISAFLDCHWSHLRHLGQLGRDSKAAACLYPGHE